MRKKLEGNGLWESSRMRLPEHQARIIETNRQLVKRQRPTLDPYKWDEINTVLAEAYREGTEICIRLFEPYGDRTVTGTISKIDVLTRKLMVSGVWVQLLDIVDASIT